MTSAVRSLPHLNRIWIALAGAALLGAGGVVIAQIEGSDRGIAPIDSSSSYEVGGVTVDVSARDAESARTAGWRVAQRKGWALLWSRTNAQPVSAAPGLSDSTLDSIVAGIVVEDEQIGPKRYIARLGVLFDRARTGQLLGAHGQGLRSPPLLLIPVMWSGGTATSFETRTEWQRAWARFRPGGSPIDYVRPTGTGSDPLLLNEAQTGRPGRGWWRMILDQFGAADVIVAEVAVERSWPGGPVLARFTARHGPDDSILDRFTLRAPNGDGLSALMDEGVRRMDASFSQALRDGRLRPDPSLVIEEEPEELSDDAFAAETMADDMAVTAIAYNVQVETADAAALTAAEGALRGVPGVRGVETTSMALGGLSVMRVNYEGEISGLKIALQARGWRVEEGPGTLRIRRGAPAAPPPNAAPAPAGGPDAR
ncbi:hypothetical protein SAMN06295912_10315 [Sphingomonas laterariae]|uniref:Heavy-metal-associated domain-containing protein n=1 Tax=Edaphosphingomonas laterariae TaxID=861865 RepID=A0A239CRV7_9SPHN|nr:hypothetical protein [Sphingomonas laterariae]SNS22996.1 hypothetical protein SAMN06295912_10315 [Sphingomonas laterariae]